MNGGARGGEAKKEEEEEQMKLAIVNFTRDHSPRKERERERRLIFPNRRRDRLPSSFPRGLMQSQGLPRISLRRQMRGAYRKAIRGSATKKLGRRHFSGSYGSVAVGGGGRRRGASRFRPTDRVRNGGGGGTFVIG